MANENQKQDMKTINVLMNSGYDYVQADVIKAKNNFKAQGIEVKLFKIWNDGGISAICKEDKKIKTEDLKFDVIFIDNYAGALDEIIDFYKKIPNKNEVKAVYIDSHAPGLDEIGFEFLGSNIYDGKFDKILAEYCKNKEEKH